MALIDEIIEIAKSAGNIIMDYYGSEISHSSKSDGSPVTLADIAAGAYIEKELLKFGFPIQSEENIVPIEQRKNWTTYWLIDPLDGTKDFLSKTGEFTVNIALIQDGSPTLGVVHCPPIKKTYWGSTGNGAFLNGKKIWNHKPNPVPIGTISNHHSNIETKEFFDRNQIKSILKRGSSLKMCMVAEGSADIYPRLNGTSEWDTAASEVILLESNCLIVSHPNRTNLVYNKPNTRNPFFIACQKDFEWIL